MPDIVKNQQSAVNFQRLQNQKVSEQSFFQLVQFFAIVLFECNEHEDYAPAKTLMNMCFTFYHEGECDWGADRAQQTFRLINCVKATSG